ncbi:hypothetical protein [Streptomyces montanus]|uniref:hypothetical protein n=1 Tax=Streptomyces montanus TaxID=2580423 RepID=UPI001BB29F2A|nr:hypothetical protein [Streptomyces montanus]
MKTEYSGRKITIKKSSMKYGPCTFTIGDSEPVTARGDMMERPGEPMNVLGWIHRQIDLLDSKPVEPLMSAWWYRPGTVEDCPSTKGRDRGPHLRPVNGPCTEIWCVRQVKIEAQRAKRRTGITAATVSAKLTRAGFTRADLNWDSTARNDGFNASGEQRNRRVRISWRGTDYRVKELQGELPKIGAFLKSKGHPVRISGDGGYSLWVYPRGRAEPTEGQPFPAQQDAPAHAEELVAEEGNYLVTKQEGKYISRAIVERERAVTLVSAAIISGAEATADGGTVTLVYEDGVRLLVARTFDSGDQVIVNAGKPNEFFGVIIRPARSGCFRVREPEHGTACDYPAEELARAEPAQAEAPLDMTGLTAYTLGIINLARSKGLRPAWSTPRGNTRRLALNTVGPHGAFGSIQIGRTSGKVLRAEVIPGNDGKPQHAEGTNAVRALLTELPDTACTEGCTAPSPAACREPGSGHPNVPVPRRCPGELCANGQPRSECSETDPCEPCWQDQQEEGDAIEASMGLC